MIISRREVPKIHFIALESGVVDNANSPKNTEVIEKTFLLKSKLLKNQSDCLILPKAALCLPSVIIKARINDNKEKIMCLFFY